MPRITPDLIDQGQIRFEPVDMIFRIVENMGDDVAQDKVTNRLAVGDRFLASCLRRLLEFEIALRNFFRILTNQLLMQVLQIGQRCSCDQLAVPVPTFLPAFLAERPSARLPELNRLTNCSKPWIGSGLQKRNP